MLFRSNGIGPIALAFGVLSLPGANAASLSLVMFARTLPLIVFVLFGGVIADRYGRAKVVSYSDIVLSLFVLFEAYLFISGSASVSWLVLLGLVTGILHALWFPAFPGIMPQVMPEKKLQSANSVNSLGVNSANVLGYSIGGILVTLVGPGIAIAIDGLTFLVAGSLIYLLIRFDKPNQVSDEDTILQDIKLGWKEVRKRTWIIACVSAWLSTTPAFNFPVKIIMMLRFMSLLGFLFLFMSIFNGEARSEEHTSELQSH